MQNVLICGAGVAGLEAALALHTLARNRVRLTLVAPDQEFRVRALGVGDPFAVGSHKSYPLRTLSTCWPGPYVRGRVAVLTGVRPCVHRLSVGRIQA
jgi:hypothetical protein